MRLIRLTIGGLNSFEAPQTIDFEYLSSKGLFGIFGPTGSGKSTIIDGIVMSLYGPGSIPRGTKDFINTECDQAELDFVFRTVVEGLQREVEIRRVFRRSGEGIRSHQSRLILRTLEGEVLGVEDKQSEVNRQIQEILGLSDNEFLKMVVLPQGKFSDFIQLDPKDRRYMLQSLFGLEIYGDRLSERLKKVMSSLQTQRDQLEGELAAYRGVDGTQLEVLQAEQLKKNEKTQQLAGEVKQLKAVYSGLYQQFERQSRYRHLLEAQQRHMASFETHRSEQARLALHQRAQGVLTSERLLREALEQRQVLERIEAEQAAAHAEAKLAFDAHQSLFEGLAQAYGALPLMKHEAEQAAQKRNRRKTLEALKNEQIGLRHQVQENGQSLLAEQARLAELEARLRETAASLQELSELQDREGLTQEAIQALSSGLAVWLSFKNSGERLGVLALKLMEQVQTFEACAEVMTTAVTAVEAAQQDLEACRESQETLTVQREALRQRLEHQLKALGELNGALEALDRVMSDLDAAHQRMDLLEGQLRSLNRSLEARRPDYQKAMGIRLRDCLEEGQPCPVCGTPYHEAKPPGLQKGEVGDKGAQAGGHEPGSDPGSEMLSLDWLDRFESDEKQLAILKHQKMETEGLIKTLNERQETLRALGQGERQLLEQEVLRIREALDRNQAALLDMEGSLEACRKTCQRIQETLPSLNKTAEARRSEWTAANQALVSQRSKQEMVMESRARDREALAAYLKTWQPQCQLGPEDTVELETLFEALALRKSQSEARIKEIEALQLERERLRDLTMKQHQRVSGMLVEAERLTGALKTLNSQIEGLISETGLDSSRGTEEALQTLEATLNHLTQRIEETESAYPAAKDRQITLADQKDRTERDYVESAAAAKAVRHQSDERLRRFEEAWRAEGFVSEAQWREALLDPEEALSLSEQVRDYDLQARTLKEKLEEYRDLFDATLMEEAALQEAEKAARNAETAWAEALESSSRSLEALSAMKEALTRKNELESKWNLIQKESGYYEILQKLLRGNRFVEFLAMSQLDYILRVASGRLMSMTANRYRLEVDSKGNFRIADHHQGGVSRDLRSLSGGETFMASLALALAMSSRLQLRGGLRLETFLLDEGFGSLDATLLEVVMHALESLIGEDLSVGLISHVESLKTRVPVRLEVTPAEPGISGTLVKEGVN